MDTLSTGEPPDRLNEGPRRADMNAEGRAGAVTIMTFIEAPSRRTLRAGVLLALTLAAGWTDALCYLGLGRVFASFITGNILFVGLALAQGNPALLVRAGVAVVVFLASVTLGAIYLQARPAQQAVRGWRSTLARYLLVEGLILLAFALLWQLTGTPAQQPATQVVLLGVAALGMGLQGALFGAINILDVNTVALTGTELLLGMRLAQRIGGRSVERPAGTGMPFLVVLLLAYALAAFVVALAAFVVALAAPSGVTALVPCLLVAAAIVAVLVMAKQGSQV